MASQVERVFYGSNQVPGQQLSREDIKQLRFRIKRDGGTIDNVVFDPLVGQDLYMSCLKFFKNYSHGSNPTEVGHYEVGNAGANGSDFDVEINNQEIFLFREDDLVLTDAEFTRLHADLVGWTPVALRSMSSDNVQHQWLYLSRSPDNGIRFICIEDTKARIAVIAPDSPHNIAISDAFDTSLFELKSNKVSYIDPTIDQSGKYLGGSAVNGFVEKRTFAISVPYGVTNNNTFTKILEFNELFDGSRTRGAIFTRIKIQYIRNGIKHRLNQIDAYVGYDLYNKKAFVTFGNCYSTVDYNDLKKLHIVTYDVNARCHIEIYLEHKALVSMSNWISVEVCENFYVAEQSWGQTNTDHSAWKIPLLSYDWDELNGASTQPTNAALPTTGVLKTDSYIIQSGNQTPFTYVPSDVVDHTMSIAKLVGNSSNTRLVFKLYGSEGWVAVGKVERVNSVFKLSFSAISDHPDFNNGVATPYIYLSLDDGKYYVNLKIDSYHTVAKSIAIEIENENKDWEFFGSTPPDSIGTTVSDTDTDMKADLTAEVIDQGTNVPAPTSSTKVLTKQVDYAGREFWKTEEMSAMIAGRAVNLPSVPTVFNSVIGYKKILKINTAPDTDRVLWLDCYTGMANSIRCSYSICITCRTGTPTNVRWKIFSFDKQSEPFEFQLYKDSDNNAYLYAYSPVTGYYTGILTVLRSASEYSMENDNSVPDWLEMYDNPNIEASVSYTSVAPTTVGDVAFQNGTYDDLTSGIAKKLFSYNYDNPGPGNFEIATFEFASGNWGAGGVQFAVVFRQTGNKSGSGILAISFSDYNDNNIIGRLFITNIRSTPDQSAIDNLYFYVEHLYGARYKLCVHTSTYEYIGISFLNGNLTDLVMNSNAVPHTGSITKKLPWAIPTVTTYTPSP